MRMVDGRFPLAQKPGLGFDLTEESLAKYPFGGTRPMARVFHEDGSVAEWQVWGHQGGEMGSTSEKGFQA